MVTRAQVISMLKDTANNIVGTLTLVLQLSMSLLETSNPSVEEEQMPPAVAHQLANMCQELDRQRQLLQEVMNQQKSRNMSMAEMSPPRGSLPLSAMPGLPDHFPEPEDDSFSVISVTPSATVEIPSFRPSQAAPPSTNRPLAIAGIPMNSHPRGTEAAPDNHGSRAPVTTPPTLTLSQWGQKKVNWGKKHPGKSFYQVLHEDPGYLDWARPRYGSLSPDQRDFVDYACAQLENDAEMERRHAHMPNPTRRS